jgi:hypothetical protein
VRYRKYLSELLREAAIPRHLPRVVGSRIAPCFRLTRWVFLRLEVCTLGRSGIRLSNLIFDARDRSPRLDQPESGQAVRADVTGRTAVGVRDNREECSYHEQQGPEHGDFAHGRPICSFAGPGDVLGLYHIHPNRESDEIGDRSSTSLPHSR